MFIIILDTELGLNFCVIFLGNPMFNFLKSSKRFPKRLQHFTYPPVMNEGSRLSISSSMLVIFNYVYCSHLHVCEVLFHCNFGFHFSNDEGCYAPYPVFIGHFYIFFGEMSLQIIWPSIYIGLLFIYKSSSYILITIHPIYDLPIVSFTL